MIYLKEEKEKEWNDKVCCSDGSHCCPLSYECDLDGMKCDRDGFESIPLLKKVQSNEKISSKIVLSRSIESSLSTIICPGWILFIEYSLSIN